ncbi:MAG TPA: SDR family oxidoreductase [Chloroflexota bacterium]|nr:SDR family oxidoreductase [Chloroflexota bacterium]
MDLGLKNKVVVLTGGSMGIGYACAHLFAEEGARLAIAARQKDRLEAAAQRIHEETGAEVLPVSADMTNTEDVTRFVGAALQRYGRIDVLVNVAGSAPGGLVEDLTDEAWWGSLNLKFLGYVRTIREVAPIMVQQGGGRILNLIGNDGNKPAYWELAPGAANAAGHNLTQALAEQYGKHNILINAVNPGPVGTERWDGLGKAMARDKGITQEEAHHLAVHSLPLGRICTPQEVARLVVFLCSEQNTYITGALVPIDGAQRKALMDV